MQGETGRSPPFAQEGSVINRKYPGSLFWTMFVISFLKRPVDSKIDREDSSSEGE